MRDVQVLHLVFFLNDNEPLPGIIFRGQRVLQQRFLTRAYIDDIIQHASSEQYPLSPLIVRPVI